MTSHIATFPILLSHWVTSLFGSVHG